MNIRIIEDCSPYYIIIEHSGQFDLINQANKILHREQFDFVRDKEKFKNYRLISSDTEKLLELSPLKLLKDCCTMPFSSFYKTSPGPDCWYPPHRDGSSLSKQIMWSLNYMISVQDDLCPTNWFSDDVVGHLKQIVLTPGNTNLENFDKSIHKPSKSTVFRQNECALINTDIFHNFDNSRSASERIILTLRDGVSGNRGFSDIVNIFRNYIQK